MISQFAISSLRHGSETYNSSNSRFYFFAGVFGVFFGNLAVDVFEAPLFDAADGGIRTKLNTVARADGNFGAFDSFHKFFREAELGAPLLLTSNL